MGDKNRVLIVSYSIPRVKFWSFIQTVRLKGAKLCTPESFSCKQTVVKAIVITWITNLLNDHEIKIRQNMSLFVKVYRNFTSVLLCTHGWFVVSKSDFKLVSCGSYILDIAFITGDQVNNVFRFTMKVLSNKIFSACTSTRKMIGFH